MKKKMSITILLIIAFMCANPHARPITFASADIPSPIKAAIAESGINEEYEVLRFLLVESNYAAVALSVQGKNTLVIVECSEGEWEVTINNATALYKNSLLEIKRHNPEGIWNKDGFMVFYITEMGNWPYFSFDRIDHGRWELGLFMLKDGDNIWRIDRDYGFKDRWVFTSEQYGVRQKYEAHAPFETDLEIFNASSIPTSPQGAKAMLGTALIPIVEERDPSMPIYTASLPPTSFQTAPPDTWIPPTPGPTLPLAIYTGTQSIFPKTYELSEADAERYRKIWQNANKDAHAFLAEWFFLTLEEKVAQWIENYKDYENYDGIVDGLPSDDVISDEQAVFLAYTALRDKYGYDENVLRFFYPRLTYDIFVKDAPLWKIELCPFNDDIFYGYGHFYIDIDAKTGIVLNCRGPEDAIG